MRGTLCHFPGEETLWEEFAAPLENLLQADSVQCLLLTPGLVFPICGNLSRQKLLQISRWIHLSVQHTKNFRQEKWRQRRLQLRVIVFYYHPLPGRCDCSSFRATSKLSVLHTPARSKPAEVFSPSPSFRYQLQEVLDNLQAHSCKYVLKSLCLQAYGIRA